MLRYKKISKDNPTWDVHIFMNPNATVGNFVREIKKIPSTPDVVIEKTIFIYRLGILVGGAIFRNDEPITWVGTASEIWGLPVERCELIKHSDTDYVFKIYIKEPYEGAYVAISPILPSLIANAYATVPQGVYTRS